MTDGSSRMGQRSSDPTVGAQVEVRSDFSGRWINGFAVAETSEQGFRLRRKSDRWVLPDWFSEDDVRLDRR